MEVGSETGRSEAARRRLGRQSALGTARPWQRINIADNRNASCLHTVMTTAGPSRTQLQSLETYQGTSSSRLKFLYSDFTRQRHSNPASFTSNVEWWKRTLEAIVLNGWQSNSSAESSSPDRLVFHAPGTTIIEQFRLEGVGKPLGLATVIVSGVPSP